LPKQMQVIMDTSSYNIYCPHARLGHEPPMLNFWFTSCLRRQEAAVFHNYGSLNTCRDCAIGEEYLRLSRENGSFEALEGLCRKILFEQNMAGLGSPG